MSGNEHGLPFVVVVVVELALMWQKRRWRQKRQQRRHVLQEHPRCRPSLLVLYKKERVYAGG